jgi:hypothetical protein
MASCAFNARTNRYLPDILDKAIDDIETDCFHYDLKSNTINFKLLANNLYRDYFQQVYPNTIEEHELTDDMLDVLQSYTNSRTNECYMRTNLNLLSANLSDIDWTYVNRLRSLIRCLIQINRRHVYYRGLTLSNREIGYYIAKCNDCFYTTSFQSFTTDRLLIYPGNAVILLNMETSSNEAKTNLADISKWSVCEQEKEALLAVGSRLKVMSVHYFGCKWEIEMQLINDD